MRSEIFQSVLFTIISRDSWGVFPRLKQWGKEQKNICLNSDSAGFSGHTFCGAGGQVVVWTDIRPFLTVSVDAIQSRPRTGRKVHRFAESCSPFPNLSLPYETTSSSISDQCFSALFRS